MKAIFQKAADEIDQETGFRCRTVYLNTEPSVLHYHDYYEFFLTLSDKVNHTINGREEVLPKGTLVFIRKNDIHIYKGVFNSECSFVNLAFTDEILKKLFDFFSDSFPSKHLLEDKNPPKVIVDSIGINKIMMELNAINTISIEDYHKKSLAYRKLLVTLFYKYFAEYSFDIAFQQMPSWLKSFDMEIKRAENFSMSREDIIKLSGKSREYLSRMIKLFFNTTFSNYINDIRLNYVANSLVTTDLPIIDLFYNVGFENLSYAYVLFKKKFKTTPRMMRETEKKN